MNVKQAMAALGVVVLMAFPGTVGAEVSLNEAKKIGEKSLKDLIEQSYHYRVEYDTVVVVPVYSKTVWKNDFYLLYFLKDDYFQVEMEVDKKTGKPAILATGTMAPPYHALPSGTFNYRYFSVDSMLHYATVRQRLAQDSARLDYFGVIPSLGKRGVIWEVYSKEGIVYISLGGPEMEIDHLITDMNLSQRQAGNFAADSIRMSEITLELKRIQSLPDEEKKNLRLYDLRYNRVVDSLKQQRDSLVSKFPVLGRQFPLE